MKSEDTAQLQLLLSAALVISDNNISLSPQSSSRLPQQRGDTGAIMREHDTMPSVVTSRPAENASNDELINILKETTEIISSSPLIEGQFKQPKKSNFAGGRLTFKRAVQDMKRQNLEREEEFRQMCKIAISRTADNTGEASIPDTKTTCTFLAQTADKGIPFEDALKAGKECEELNEYWWSQGYKKQDKEQASSSSSSAVKKDDPNDNQSPARTVPEGPTKITLPPSMANDAKKIQNKLKSDALKLLRRVGLDASNPRFISATKVLSSIYKGRGYDARLASPDAVNGPCLEGSWKLLSKPTYPECLGQNDEGDFMYNLGRMSFGMFNAGDAKCSIQSSRYKIKALSVEDLPEAVPGKLKNLWNPITEGDSSPVLRKYDITVNLTIEPQEEGNAGALTKRPSDGGVIPASRIHAIMTSHGYMLPDHKVDNRFSVWFTGGTLRPVSTSLEWQHSFGTQSCFFGRRTLKQRANVLAARVFLGAELTDEREVDGSIHYKFLRPISGHIDILYHDNDFQVMRGNRGSIMVQKRGDSRAETYMYEEGTKLHPALLSQASPSTFTVSRGNAREA